MNVVWTSNAKRELRAVYDYIAQNSARYAQGLVDRITRKSKQLATMPYLGATVPEYEEETIRELIEQSYRIIYRVRGDRVEILSVVHGARPLPPSIPGNGS
jgi:plasmid stabilization system protein ParE